MAGGGGKRKKKKGLRRILEENLPRGGLLPRGGWSGMAVRASRRH